MGIENMTVMEELKKQTQTFKEFCKKIDNLDHFEALLGNIYITESQVLDTLEQDPTKEVKEEFQKWQEKTSEFLNICKTIMGERRKLIGDNIFGPRESDDQSIILLIHVTAAYEALKEKLNMDKELESQVFQLHNLQSKINQRFKEIFTHSTTDLLTEELPRTKSPKETEEAYKKYIEDFYKKTAKDTKLEEKITEKTKEVGNSVLPEDIFIVPENREQTVQNLQNPLIFEEPKEPIPNAQKSVVEKEVKITQPILDPIQNKVVAEAIRKRRENYDAYLKKLYEIMDDFELARCEVQDASNGRLKITDYLQNRYNKGVDIQSIVVKEINRIKELEKYIEDPKVDLKIPNSDMSKGEMIAHFENGWIPGNNYIPMKNQRDALPLPKMKGTLYNPISNNERLENVREIAPATEKENPAKYPFGTELILHENAKLWGIRGPLAGENPIPAKYPLDATRYTKGYLVTMPNGLTVPVYDEATLSSALDKHGKVSAVEAFDGFYSINDVTLKEKAATIKH